MHLTMFHNRNRRRERIEEGLVRDARRTKLSNQRQLELLDIRLGVGVGAIKERTRLMGENHGSNS